MQQIPCNGTECASHPSMKKPSRHDIVKSWERNLGKAIHCREPSHSRLDALILLVRCWTEENGARRFGFPKPWVCDPERLEGLSPVSCRMVHNVAQPGVSTN